VNEETEGWSGELGRRDGYPLIAVAFGAAMIALLAVLVPIPPAEGNRALLQVVIAGPLLAALLWGVGWVTTIRHASSGWQVGSYILLALVAMFAVDRGTGQANSAMAYDLTMLDEVKLDPNAHLAPPEHPDRGPISRRWIAFLKAMTDDQRATENQIGALQLQLLDNPYRLKNEAPDLLHDCARTEKGKALVRGYRARQEARAKELDAWIANSGWPEKTLVVLRDAARRYNGIHGLKEMTETQVALFDVDGERCALIARAGKAIPNWEWSWAFAGEADRDAYIANRERRGKLNGARNRIEAMTDREGELKPGVVTA